jgi:hypothetical protein
MRKFHEGEATWKIVTKIVKTNLRELGFSTVIGIKLRFEAFTAILVNLIR